MDASAMSAARAVILALAAAALPLLAVALAASAGFQPGTGLIPKKAHASPAKTSHPQANGRIAFSSNKAWNYEIYTMNAAGSGVVRLTRDRGENYSPSWSPDGSRIAFASIRNGNWGIYAMNAAGSGVTRLTDNSADDNFPSWSPNGRRIAFASDRDGNWEIYAMNLDGSGVARLTNNPDDDRGPSWSPDGRRIAFTSYRDGNSEIYAMNADGSDVARLSNNSANEWGASWSPDGRRIAFVSDRDGNGEIYAMNADGSDVARLSNNLSAVRDLSWGPPTQAEKAALTATAVVKAEAQAAAAAEARAAATAEARTAATPAPTPDPCRPGEPCVSLHINKTTFGIGETIKLTLAAINYSTLPKLTIRMVIEIPDGLSVRSADMMEACTPALCNITFKDIPIDGNRKSSIELFPNEPGDFLAHATLKWFDGEATEENIEEWREENISVKVNPKPPTPPPPVQPAVTPPAATPALKRRPPPPPCVPAPCSGCPPRSGASAAADTGWLLAGLAIPGLAFSGGLRKRAPFTPPNKPSTPAGSRPGRGRRG